MDVMRAANAREIARGDVIHLEVGQPSTPAPQGVLAAAERALRSDKLGYTDAFDTTEEYRLMSEAGLSFDQILGSLTTAPSARFGFPRKGSVAAGMDGDLTVLTVDPAADITGFAKVAYTIRAGKVIYTAKQ